MLSYSAGLGFLSSSNRSRYVNLRDRLTEQTLQTTLKVFRVQLAGRIPSQSDAMEERTTPGQSSPDQYSEEQIVV